MNEMHVERLSLTMVTISLGSKTPTPNLLPSVMGINLQSCLTMSNRKIMITLFLKLKQ